MYAVFKHWNSEMTKATDEYELREKHKIENYLTTNDIVVTKPSRRMTKPTDEYETPWNLFNALNLVFDFDVDICATKENSKCTMHFEDIFSEKITSCQGMVGFMNPPYSKPGKFIERALQLKFKTLVMLLPVDCTTEWWRALIRATGKNLYQLTGETNIEAVEELRVYNWVKRSSCLFLLPKRVKFINPVDGSLKDVSRGNCIVVVNL